MCLRIAALLSWLAAALVRAPGALSVLVDSVADGEMMRGSYEATEVGRDEDDSVLTHWGDH
jgi:hypothetical protein